MKKKKKNSLKKKTQKFQKRSVKTLKNKRKKLVNKKPRSKKKRKKAIKTKRKFRNKTKKSNQRSRAIVSGLLRLNDKIKSLVRFNFNLDQSLQHFFNGISNKVSAIKKVIIEEREKQKILKIKQMENEKKEAQRKFIHEGKIALQAKKTELKEEQKLEKERKLELQKFIRLEQAELRKERAEKQRNFLEQIKLEKKIDQFRKREALEIKSLEKYVLSQQRESYEEVQQRIDKIKEKYKSLREQKINEAIRERVASLGIKVEDTDDKATLLEKERIYNEERQKIEYALESFYRSAHSLCFQLNKKYIPKYLSIIRCIDKRFETGEIYIKWDDSIEEDWLILIYIKNNSPDEGIIIEDKSNPEKHMTYEFQSNEIFKASDVMVDALTKLLDNERNKRKVN
ncbi:hypothetical protein OAN82_02500 [Pelagibacteraceae bacterium]|nr:hypothetical protein [Pelagibacteraceae bacterium]MDC1158267.1 hypothetical protein [Pelagibacteraceae bacterium]